MVAAPAAAEDLKSLRDRAKKAPAAQAPDLWLELAEVANVARTTAMDRKASEEASARFGEAVDHLDPLRLSIVAAWGGDSRVNVAMVRQLKARGRNDEAAAECRAMLGRLGVFSSAVDACRDCRGDLNDLSAGAASFPVFAHWLTGDEDEYRRGLARGLGPWSKKVLVRSTPVDGREFRSRGYGVVIGDESAARLARTFEVPFVALAPWPEERDSTRSAVPPGSRQFVPFPGPNALATRLLDAARRQGARRVALVIPEDGGNVALAHAIERAAPGTPTVSYVAGRREHKDDARRVRATGADAVVLLGPAEESADWVPALRSSGPPLLVLGTDELDPEGFHEQARRALEGAIYVRSFWTPADTMAWDVTSSSAWIAGWAVGRAIAQGADSPRTLSLALEKNASMGWFTVPREVATIDVFRVKGGKSEKLP